MSRLSGRALFLIAATISFSGSAIASDPPVARVEPVTDDYYGTKVTDPYRWMESGKDPQWMPWLKAQADSTNAQFRAIPGRNALYRDITERSEGLASVTRAIWAKGHLFYQNRPAGAEDYQLLVRDGKGEPRLLFDPAAGARDQVIDDWLPSPDGKYVALALSKRGTERSVLQVVETETGRVLPERIEDTGGMSWLPDSSGFAYLRFVGEHGTPSYYVNNEMRLHRLGASSPDVRLPTRDIASVPVRAAQFAAAFITPNSDTALLAVRDGRSEFALYRGDLDSVTKASPNWTRIADFSDTIVDASLSGDDLYLLSRKAASNGQILRLSARQPSLASAAALSIPGDAVIQKVIAAASGAFVQTLEGGISGLWFIPKDGAARRISLPIEGTISWVENDPAKDDAFIGMAGWFTPGQVFHVAENGDVHDIGLVPPPPFDAKAYEARRHTAKAADDTAIPYTILSKRGLPNNPRTPLLLEAYGSYGTAQMPRFKSALLPFLDRGGVYVMANVRGGGEFGRAWHYAGKAATKATTWRDAIAVAEKLVADGVTSSATMSLIGTSAGGVMVGGAVNERPNLFSGIIANVGFMNPVRYVSEQNYADIEEWGGPITDAKSFKTMYDLDPYQHIKTGTQYPAVLVTSGINDPRAATFHSAKYTARMRAASTSGEPVLLRIDFDAGHGIGSSRSQSDALWSDIYSFVLWQAGVPEFQPANGS